jgi:hypothetical protein
MLADAVQILKPFFLEMMSQKVLEEQTRVLDQEFGAEEVLDKDVAFHYYFSKEYPEAQTSSIADHMHKYSRTRESFLVAEQQLPFISLNQQRKNLIARLDEQ